MNYYAKNARICTAIHAVYDFDQRDWANVFNYTDVVEAAVHIPKPGEAIPLTTPEYEWTYVDEDKQLGIIDKISCLTRMMLTGKRQVRMRPMKTGAVGYVHDNVAEVISNGGFHINRDVVALEGYTRGDWKTAALLGGSFLAGSTSAVLSGAAMGVTGPALALTAVASGFKSVALVTAWSRFSYWRAGLSRPIFAHKTVSAHIVTSYKEKGQEEIAHVVRFRAGKPRRLVPRPIESTEVDGLQINRVTSALVMAKNKIVGKAQMAGALLRDNCNPKRVRDTIRHASRLADYVIPNGDSHPPWYYKYRWACMLLPTASAIQSLATLLQAAPSLTVEAVMLAAATSIWFRLWGGVTILLWSLSAWWVWDGAGRFAPV